MIGYRFGAAYPFGASVLQGVVYARRIDYLIRSLGTGEQIVRRFFQILSSTLFAKPLLDCDIWGFGLLYFAVMGWLVTISTSFASTFRFACFPIALVGICLLVASRFRQSDQDLI